MLCSFPVAAFPQLVSGQNMYWKQLGLQGLPCLETIEILQMKVSYSGKKMLQKIFVSKEKKQVPGFKAGRARLTV